MNLDAQIHVLNDLKNLLKSLNSTSFTQKNNSLFGGTIGAHFRHIIEFYICCFEQRNKGVVNYDLRKRDATLEKDTNLGVLAINQVLEKVNRLKHSKNESLLLDSGLNKGNANAIQTSFYRELSYCMDHCVHHQSLIKIALQEQGLLHLIDENFGVAFSTQKYRQECA
ncbi:MAG: hypothetical protein ACON30_04945 [Flavobacteriaceae bacterium]